MDLIKAWGESQANLKRLYCCNGGISDIDGGCYRISRNSITFYPFFLGSASRHVNQLLSRSSVNSPEAGAGF